MKLETVDLQMLQSTRCWFNFVHFEFYFT